MTTPFWSNDPTILFNKNYIFQLWPTQQMNFEAKLNAISRLVILLSILGFLSTRNGNLLVICVITLAIIYSLYKLRKQKIISSKQGFTLNTATPSPTASAAPQATTTNPVTLETVLKSDFYQTSKKNPFGNVLLTEITDNPDRKSAAPAFNPDVSDDINSAVKKQTQMLNPGIKNTNKQLYGDLKDNFDLDMSLLPFYSTASTRVTNDQGAFAEYLYGNMPSSKSSGPDGAFARVQDNFRYILI
jgi:hypothetical protein